MILFLFFHPIVHLFLIFGKYTTLQQLPGMQQVQHNYYLMMLNSQMKQVIISAQIMVTLKMVIELPGHIRPQRMV